MGGTGLPTRELDSRHVLDGLAWMLRQTNSVPNAEVHGT